MICSAVASLSSYIVVFPIFDDGVHFLRTTIGQTFIRSHYDVKRNRRGSGGAILTGLFCLGLFCWTILSEIFCRVTIFYNIYHLIILNQSLYITINIACWYIGNFVLCGKSTSLQATIRFLAWITKWVCAIHGSKIIHGPCIRRLHQMVIHGTKLLT